MSDKISIIINCYNGGVYLKECLDSVEKQTYKNFEVIFWDNKSTDNSKEIFDKYSNSKFKYYLSNKFTNLSQARNMALNFASGNYVAFLDTDDIWLKNKLEKQIKFMKKYNLDISFTNYFLRIEKKNNINIKKYYKVFPKKNLIENLLRNYFISISTVIFKKKKIEDMYFDEKFHLIGDYDLLMRNILHKLTLGYNEPLAFIRFHDNNETSKYFLKNIFENKVWINKNQNKFQNFENYKKLKINYRYNLLKYLILKKKYHKIFYFFLFLNLEKKIKILVFYIKSQFFNLSIK